MQKSLEKDRDLRFQSANEMRAELQRLKRDSALGRAPASSPVIVPAAPTIPAPSATSDARAVDPPTSDPRIADPLPSSVPVAPAAGSSASHAVQETTPPKGNNSRLELGRAVAMSGDKDKARTAYQQFLTLWKDADPEIPILKEAKAENATLQ